MKNLPSRRNLLEAAQRYLLDPSEEQLDKLTGEPPRLTTQAIQTVLMSRFDPAIWASLIHEFSSVTAGLPPAALKMVLDAAIPKELLSSMKAVNSGTAPLDPQVARAFEETYGIPVLQAYGATEFSGGGKLPCRFGLFPTHGDPLIMNPLPPASGAATILAKYAPGSRAHPANAGWRAVASDAM